MLPLVPKANSMTEDHYQWGQAAGTKTAAAGASQLECQPVVACVVAESMRGAIAGSGYVDLSVRVATVAVELAAAPACHDKHAAKLATGSVDAAQSLVQVSLIEVEESRQVVVLSEGTENHHGYSH
jgi:hypothetical protein